MHTIEKIMAGTILLSAICIALVMSVLNAKASQKNEKAIDCIDRYLSMKDKNYQSLVTSCKAEPKEIDLREFL